MAIYAILCAWYVGWRGREEKKNKEEARYHEGWKILEKLEQQWRKSDLYAKNEIRKGKKKGDITKNKGRRAAGLKRDGTKKVLDRQARFEEISSSV